MDKYCQVALNKLQLNLFKTFFKGIMAGVFISIACILSLKASCYSLANKPLICGLVFPVGLLLVVFTSSALFTGDCLMFIPILNKQARLKIVIRYLLVALLGNLVGCLLIAFLSVFGVYNNDLIKNSLTTAFENKTNMNLLNAFTLGVLCNVLVTLSVLFACNVKNIVGKALVIYFPIFAFVACGFEHSIANAYYTFAGFIMGDNQSITLLLLSLSKLFIVLCGNILGGFLVSLAYSKNVLSITSND